MALAAVERESLGQRMERMARERRLSAYKIATALGVWHPTVYNWWRGRSRPGPGKLQAYADLMGVTMDDLTRGTDGPANEEVLEKLRSILERIARGDPPPTAGLPVVSPEQVQRYLNRMAGGDFLQLSPEEQLEVIREVFLADE